MTYIAFVLIIISTLGNFTIKASTLPIQIAEKVYLQLDRRIYNSGDDVWFKAYVIDALSNNPSSNTSNLHVELISPKAEIEQIRIVRIENGLGNGDFSLSDSIPSGRYTIKAYTNYMRNFSDEFFFNTEIIIINPFDKGNGLNDSAKVVEDHLFINFFPEGGSLVDNIPSLVGFKVTNAIGKGSNVSGNIYSSSGELITSFKSSHLGMGLFTLKPEPETKYYAVFKEVNGIEYSAPLPNSFQSGLTIHAFVLQDNKLLIKIHTNQLTLPGIIGKEMFFTFSSRNLFTKTLSFKLDTLLQNYIIPLSDFPEGIIKVTLSNNLKLPLCERLIFYKKTKDVSISLTSDKPQYKTREPVRINLSVSGDTSYKRAYFSLSATEKEDPSDSIKFGTSIASWFLLESDIHGQVEDPSYYFDLSNENRFQDLDLLLVTQGWRDFQWKYEKDKQFQHELGFSISGKVKKNNDKKPYPHAKINLGVFTDRTSNFLSTKSDSSGAFSFTGLDIIGKARIVASVADKDGRLEGWLSIDSIPYLPPEAYTLVHEKFILKQIDYSKLKQEALDQNTIRKKYKLSDTININEVYVTAKRRETAIETKMMSNRLQYGRPDKELVFTPAMETYPNILRVLDGRVPGVEVDERRGIVMIRGQIPLVLIDGIPQSVNELLFTPPSTVDRVDILYWSSPFGSRGANGIINVITKIGDYNYEALNMTHSKSTTLIGFDAPRIFYSPIYSTTNPTGTQPDSRKTVHWEPNIIIENGRPLLKIFYNSDKNTDIDLTVEGLTDNGIPLFARMTYTVK